MYKDNDPRVDTSYTKEWLEVLYDRYAASLLGIIRRILKDGCLSEEILHKTFLRLWKVRDSYDPKKESPFVWMNKIARQIVMEAVVTDKPDRIAKNDLSMLIYNAEVLKFIAGKKIISDIEQLERNALKEMLFYALTIDQVAQKLNTSPQLLKSKLIIALQKITANNG